MSENDEIRFKVWPSGEVYEYEDVHPSWLGDDYIVVWACDEDSAVAKAEAKYC